MLSTKTFLSLDFGSGSLKLAEFEVAETGGLRLKQFGVRPLGLLGSQDAAREGLLKKAFAELVAERPISGKLANVCAPGYQVFNKFVKLPPVDSSKAAQIIQYEAQQNIPFPLSEVVWDYQKVGTTPDGAMEVLLVAIKSDLVESIFRTTADSGRSLQVVDVSISALSNAYRYTYGQSSDECVMLLDIGAKTSSVLFFEKGRFFCRSLNVGANAITQEFAAEAKMAFAQAEQFKISEGFVSLGGAFEEPDNQQQAQISKIARNVLTRLHIQINQTIQFYQKQADGTTPVKIYLAGGGSTLPYTAEFFAEKFGVPVEYFNPLQNVEIAPEVNLDELQKAAHSMGELVGLALRNMAECPLELNLVPMRVRESQKLEQKKPFFVASVAALVVGLFALGWFYGNKMVAPKKRALAEIENKIAQLEGPSTQISAEKSKISKVQTELGQMTEWVGERFLWFDILSNLHKAAAETQVEVSQLLSTDTGREIKAGLWVEQFIPELPDMEVGLEEPGSSSSSSEASAASTVAMRRMMTMMRGRPGGGGAAAAGNMSSSYADLLKMGEQIGGESGPANTNEIREIKLICKGVNLNQLRVTANDELAFRFEEKIKSMTNLFDVTASGLAAQSAMTNAYANTFTFNVKLKLKTPVKI